MLPADAERGLDHPEPVLVFWPTKGYCDKVNSYGLTFYERPAPVGSIHVYVYTCRECRVDIYYPDRHTLEDCETLVIEYGRAY